MKIKYSKYSFTYFLLTRGLGTCESLTPSAVQRYVLDKFFDVRPDVVQIFLGLQPHLS